MLKGFVNSRPTVQEMLKEVFQEGNSYRMEICVYNKGIKDGRKWRLYGKLYENFSYYLNLVRNWGRLNKSADDGFLGF